MNHFSDRNYLIRLNGYLNPDDLPWFESLKITVGRQDHARGAD
jgi:hypothetical protein